ncbi:MAG: type II toxin-antitoxin system HicA family toxin [Sulfuricella sp.]
MFRLGWEIKRQSGSHRTLSRPGFPDYVFAFHDGEEIGPKMLARIAKHTRGYLLATYSPNPAFRHKWGPQMGSDTHVNTLSVWHACIYRFRAKSRSPYGAKRNAG